MRALLEVFSLEMKALVRSKTLALLLVASAAWMLCFPLLVRGDGTADGALELDVHYSLGGVFALVLVSLTASATGALARERTARRLQLTMIRPVRLWAIAFGKIVAHVAVGAVVLALAVAVLLTRCDPARVCCHVESPRLPSPRDEARAMYAAYMADPQTPDAVKRAGREVVLRLLENRAIDHYQVIGTNETASWTFPVRRPAVGAPTVRLRFTNQYEMRQSVRGVFRLGGAATVVSNVTQSVLRLPLAGEAGDATELSFLNAGDSALMLRPRCDIELLSAADAFAWNALRAFVAMVSIVALAVSFGVLLSAGLGRPVALFVAFASLAVGEMSPSVLRQYPDELETSVTDRVGLAITRFAAAVTRPVSEASPLGALSKGECVEPRSVAALALADLVVLPFALSLLCAVVMPRKQEES